MSRPTMQILVVSRDLLHLSCSDLAQVRRPGAARAAAPARGASLPTVRRARLAPARHRESVRVCAGPRNRAAQATGATVCA
jgi:hypothetical protein